VENNDPGKLALAARLRRETTMTIREIADRLQTAAARALLPNFSSGGKPMNENDQWTKQWIDPYAAILYAPL
jgi:hypothetical protein